MFEVLTNKFQSIFYYKKRPFSKDKLVQDLTHKLGTIYPEKKEIEKN